MTYAYFVLMDDTDKKPCAYLVTSTESDFFELHNPSMTSLSLQAVSPDPERLRLALHRLAHRTAPAGFSADAWRQLQYYRENVLRILNAFSYTAQAWQVYDPFSGVKDLNFP